ncbi:MAG: electron transfer flavoprotein subunit alpha/FixB family protein [Gammaproteobacteria bacterium]|nr:electron transfer flavoprotein subunit alpha/FixB family protein [Gammaproteobacteria bacterium]
MAGMRILLFSESDDMLPELLFVIRNLGGPPDKHISSIAISPHAIETATDCLALGVDEAFVVITEGTVSLDASALGAGLSTVTRIIAPDLILVGATQTGSEVMAHLAQHLEVPCLSDCLALCLDAHGGLLAERRVYGGRFIAQQRLEGRPLIASVPPRRFPRATRTHEPRGVITRLTEVSLKSRIRTRSVSGVSRSAVDITKADVIVAAGRGVKTIDDLSLIEALAHALGGVLAGSRPLTGDVDWLPADRRVGLSGQTVKPNLYIACGISGQIEHIVGMRGARTVVAINTDPEAPIHVDADYSIIGDLYEIVPAILEILEEASLDGTLH